MSHAKSFCILLTKQRNMRRILFFFLFFYFVSNAATAQTRDELERQRQQLKREIDETQKLLTGNKAETRQNLTTLSLLSNKVNLQDRVIENIGKDLNILDNNIYTIQKDINKYDRLLDTLKQEYAKSMVYAYKNRGNYEFLNFIFSADNFNDAIKRVTYLKSYRNYREMQGENIKRTQELRRKRLEDMGVTKQKKSSTLEVQAKEMTELEKQKAEQDRIVLQLKKEGNSLNARIGAKQKQMAKVNGLIKSAIAKAIREDNERRIAAEKAEKKRKDDLASSLRAKRAEETKNVKITSGGKPAEPVIKKPLREAKIITPPENISLNNESIALNNSFERNKGSLPWPVDNGAVLNHFGPNKFQSGATFQNDAVTISSAIGSSVKAVFDGTVILVNEVEDAKFMVTLKHGGYYTTYWNLSNVSVKKDQEVKTGQMLGKVAPNLDGIGSIDFYSAKGYTNLDPEKWLRRR